MKTPDCGFYAVPKDYSLEADESTVLVADVRPKKETRHLYFKGNLENIDLGVIVTGPSVKVKGKQKTIHYTVVDFGRIWDITVYDSAMVVAKHPPRTCKN